MSRILRALLGIFFFYAAYLRFVANYHFSWTTFLNYTFLTCLLIWLFNRPSAKQPLPEFSTGLKAVSVLGSSYATSVAMGQMVPGSDMTPKITFGVSLVMLSLMVGVFTLWQLSKHKGTPTAKLVLPQYVEPAMIQVLTFSFLTSLYFYTF